MKNVPHAAGAPTRPQTLDEVRAQLDATWGPSEWDGMVAAGNLYAVKSPDMKVMSKLIVMLQQETKTLEAMNECVRGSLVSCTPEQFDKVAAIKPIIISKLFEKLTVLALRGVEEAKKAPSQP